mmetsp:Transcript_28494/g.74866  ORF Transcript_28494/g.74866 Transcript_28494/m.74866 type:complete len:191 (-) Transcript_28494:194-766(-)|eukprot:CAMPEP_0182916526 /NCGR_PEP_ID=MMETSP0105_2-20130417/995_1 /TAXON_ID=81532 ORGANISM="Acanthoeca-like sp., Strain 10tr" /NCGR_SAMPLE_ID=MMETSP0105_2 /ASSEMBLY_ACC=CAM_ASM_000205 /LENGTH=190 /DNA_ID=CAMNT_0025053485 /DNA_START=114 /DNA_END=686 /DNA_ORIENTATION=+
MASVSESLTESLTSFRKEAKKKYNRLTGQEPEPDEEQGLLAELGEEVDETCKDCLPKLSRTERFYAVCWCLVIGFGCQALSIFFLGTHNIKGFAIAYSLGTVSSLASSFFLFGVTYQIKNMFKETRIIATTVMLAAIGLTLTAALYWKNIMLCIVFVCVQFLACVWYTLSFIPFARRMVTNCLSGMVGGF